MLFTLHNLREHKGTRTGEVACKHMLRQVDTRKVGSCIEGRSHHTTEADEAVEHSLHIGRVFCYKASAAEKLKHIPQVSENYSKGCLNKLRGVAVKHTPYAPDKKQKSADPPCNLMALCKRLYTIKLFHILNPFKCIHRYYNTIKSHLPHIEKNFLVRVRARKNGRI
jgi:hypothetical protein